MEHYGQGVDFISSMMLVQSFPCSSTRTAPLVFQVSVRHVSVFDDKVRIHLWEVTGTLDVTTKPPGCSKLQR